MKKKENTSNDTIKHVRFISLTKKFDDQSIHTSQLRLKCSQSSSKCFCSYIKIKQYYLFECRYGIMCIKRNCEFHHPNGRFAAGDSNRPWTNRGQRRPTFAEIVRIHAPRAAQSNLTEKIVSRPAPNFQQQSPRSPTFSPHVRDNIRKDSSPTRPTYSFSPQESRNARPQQRSSPRSFSASYSSSSPRNNRDQRYFQKSS